MQWYYTIDGDKRGPVEERDMFEMVGRGVLKPSDLVWNEKMGDKWVEASTVDGLFSSPPPVPPGSPAGSSVGSEGGAAGGRLPASVSCTVPVDLAWNRMIEMLFKPFGFEKWFILGFSAWLSTLGSGTGGGLSMDGDLFKALGRTDGSFADLLGRAQSFLIQYYLLIAVIAAIGVVAAIGVWVFLAWLRARGQFMFLDNVVRDRPDISRTWREFSAQGNSLFFWNIGYALVCAMIVLVIAATAFFGAVLPCMSAGGWVTVAVPSIIFSGLALLVFSVLTAFIGRFRDDFVVPIMYKCNIKATEAWRKFLSLFRARPWVLILYGLFYLLLSIGAGTAVVFLVIITCFIAGCLMLIPYVGSVLMLPVAVFFRCYSLHYLRQFGPEYDLFASRGR